MRRLLALLVVLCLASCGGGASSDKPSRQELLRRGKVRELKNLIDITAQQIEKNPLNRDTILEDLARYEDKAGELGDQELLARCRELAKKAPAAFDRAVATEVPRTIEKVRDLIRKGEIQTAHFEMQRLVRNVAETPQAAEAQAELQRVELVARAEHVYKQVIAEKLDRFKLNEEWEKAEGLLQGFLAIEPFAMHPKAEEVKEALAAIRPQSEQARELRKKQDAIDWLPIFDEAAPDHGRHGKRNQLANNLEHSDHTTTKVEDGVIVYKTEGDQELLVIRAIDTDGDGIPDGNEDGWKDCVVEVSFRVVKGQVVFLVRGRPNWQRVLSVDDFECDQEGFTKLRLDISDQSCRYQLFAKRPSQGWESLYHEMGPIGIALQPESEMHIESIWVKVVSSEEINYDEPEDGDEDAGGDEDGDGDG